MNRVIKILMRRDGLTEEQATAVLDDVREELTEAAEANDYELAEDIMYGELGLEMDYVFDVLGL